MRGVNGIVVDRKIIETVLLIGELRPTWKPLYQTFLYPFRPFQRPSLFEVSGDQ